MRANGTNNIGLLRLLFASLVIIGHAPEMTDGHRGRELLTSAFHTLSLGEVSVDAFFILSGYLITKSMVKTGRVMPFIERRVLRIYPAFIVASLLSVFVLGPMVGAVVWNDLPRTAARLLALREPMAYPGQLPGLTTYPLLNGSLWTISHEFRCYILVAILGSVGLLRRRRVIAAVAAASLLASVLSTFDALAVPLAWLGSGPAVGFLIGNPSEALRLTTIFLVGACWFLFGSELESRMDGPTALVCLSICVALLYRDPHLAEFGLTIFGGAALYWLAFRANLGALQRVNDRWDISYGTYLYGWPIAIYLVWRSPGISPLIVAAMALPMALMAGAASWWGLECWTKDLVRSRSARPREVGMEALVPRATEDRGLDGSAIEAG